MAEVRLNIGSTYVDMPGVFTEGTCAGVVYWSKDDNCARMPGKIEVSTDVINVSEDEEPNEVFIKVNNTFLDNKGSVGFSISVEQALFLRDFLDTFLKLDAKLNPPE